VAKAIIAVMLWGVAIIGYLRAPVAWWERIWALAAASTLVAAMPITDEIGWGAASPSSRGISGARASECPPQDPPNSARPEPEFAWSCACLPARA
jgi:hypothetical protein